MGKITGEHRGLLIAQRRKLQQVSTGGLSHREAFDRTTGKITEGKHRRAFDSTMGKIREGEHRRAFDSTTGKITAGEHRRAFA